VVETAPQGLSVTSGAGTRTSRLIRAAPEKIYGALVSPEALVVWQCPGDMTARVHAFDLRIGGGYTMSLFYPQAEPVARGKTQGREDRFTARFVELAPPHRVVEAVTFDSPEPAFGGEMTITVTLEPRGEDTWVTFLFENPPVGIRPEDNEAGTASSLEKLARYVE
jgi:uncharacterized protein YndB with AHSA1/START domain